MINVWKCVHEKKSFKPFNQGISSQKFEETFQLYSNTRKLQGLLFILALVACGFHAILLHLLNQSTQS